MWTSHAILLALVLAVSPGLDRIPLQPAPSQASPVHDPHHHHHQQRTGPGVPSPPEALPRHQLLGTWPSWGGLQSGLGWLGSRYSCYSLGACGGGGGRTAWGAAAVLLDIGGGVIGGPGGTQATRVNAVKSSRGAGSGDSSGGGQTLRVAGEGVCSDTCPLARNGVCEDGSNIASSRGKVGMQVACDFGTDCTDCGPYKGVVPTWGTDSGFHGPVDFLTRQGYKVWARTVDFEPYFVFAYTDPKADLDVSEKVDRSGCLEVGIMRVFKEVLEGPCGVYLAQGSAAASQAELAPLVVDAGSNFGYFAVYAAAMGCRVVAVEPVPRFLAFLHWNLAVNGLRAVVANSSAAGGIGAAPSTVVIVDRALSHAAGVVTMGAPKSGVWGAASALNGGVDPEQEMESVSVQTARLDDIIGDEQVLLLKVDVEGYEPDVMKSAERLLSDGRAQHILLEYSPGLPELLELGAQGTDKPAPLRAEEPPRMLLDLLRNGYNTLFLNDNFAKSGSIKQLYDPIPPLEEVLEQSLLYDLTDVHWFRNHTSERCPWPTELSRLNPVWLRGCFRAPEDSHPKGLRVMFPFNTNLWLARDRSKLPISGPVGLFGPEQDEHMTWWSQRNQQMGVGGRVCSYLPPEVQLRSRCPCNKVEVCGGEQETLIRALAAGRMPQRPKSLVAGR